MKYAEMFLDLIKCLMLVTVIIISTLPICIRMDKIISQLENIQKTINSEVEYNENI